jgi:hypothetical protein
MVPKQMAKCHIGKKGFGHCEDESRHSLLLLWIAPGPPQ